MNFPGLSTALHQGVPPSSTAPAKRPRRRTGSAVRRSAGPLSVEPFLVLFALLFLPPLGYAAYLSLFQQHLVGGTVFVGLDNYVSAVKDPQLRHGVIRVAEFFVLQVPLMLLLTLLFALALDSGLLRLAKVIRLGIFVPYAVPSVVAALMWGYLYGPDFGPFAQLSRKLDLPAPHFLSDGWMLGSLANIVTWEFVGYNMIILYAALRTIPHDLYEAAAMDGAGAWRIARSIKLPALKPALLLPLLWLVIASTKSTQDLFTSFGLWFSHAPQLLTNVKATFTQDGGVFVHWLLNTVLYAVVSALGAALLAAAGGYGFAKFRFRGDRAAFNLVLGAIMVPATALAIPTYLLFAKAALVNTPWAIILPSLVNFFGLYLMRVYAQDAVPDSVLDAARIDGAGEARIFFRIVLRLLGPGLVTVVLFTLVATWNNYFLPLIMLNGPSLYPVTVGLSSWATQAENGGAGAGSDLLALVVTGSLISIIPPVVAFLLLQRYWQSGLATGSVKQ